VTTLAAAPPGMRANRGTIHVESARLIASAEYPGQQFVQRLHAPLCARHASAGGFIHIQCDASIPMRRPLSLMRADAAEGWIEILFKIIGDGLRSLSQKKPGDTLSIIGPVGRGFSPNSSRSRNILIGGGVGIPPMVFLAEQLQRGQTDTLPLVLMGSEIPFPFDVGQSALPTDFLPDDVTGTMPFLEELGIRCRLASLSGIAGCYSGYVTDLARRYLETQSSEQLAQTELFACGPTPMLRAVAALAGEFDLPCQVSLEEYMACAVGGCAGCCVAVNTANGLAMKRVCVDGPVFEAADVFSGEAGLRSERP
jgi:dihydroorotate dehydrogenase electron transfer subunit